MRSSQTQSKLLTLVGTVFRFAQRQELLDTNPAAAVQKTLGAIDADVPLRHILRRALRKAGLPELRFPDLRHMAASRLQSQV